jgi:hypothetical protein
MTTVSVVLFILGVLLALAGIVFVFLGRFEDSPDKDEDSLEVGDVLARLNMAIEKIEKRYRWGIVMIAFGLTLIGASSWLAAYGAASMSASPPPPG